MKWRDLKGLVITAPILLAVACGGGGGGGGGGSDDTGGGSGGDSTTQSLEIELTEGAFWEFFWTAEQISFAQGSGTDAEIDVGRYRVELGSSTLIEGREAFPLIITGDTNGGEFAPRWTHVAVGDDGSLLGSTDGASLETIYDASIDTWNGGGMFVDFGDNDIEVADGAFPGVYNSPTVIVAVREFEDARCEVFLGVTVCDDDSTQFSEREFFKEGIGPVGYALRIVATDDGGGFFTSTEINDTIELIQTSLTSSDGTVFSLPPWEQVADLNIARSGHSAVVLGGKIYVLGGITSAGPATDTVEVYDPATDSWSFDDAMPAASTAPAVAVAGRIYVAVDTTTVWVFDPAFISGTRWGTSVPINGAGVPLFDVAPYNDTTFGFGEILVGTNSNPLGTGALTFGGYAPSTNQWLFSSSGPQGYAELLRFSVETVGDTMYVIGGFGQSGGLLDDRGARDNVMEFDLVLDSWQSTGPGRLNLARDDHASAVLNDLIYVFGGAPVSCSLTGCSRGNPFREAEVFDPGTNNSTDLPQMFQPREEFAAVALSGNIYVIGGSDGTDELSAVERFTPD